MREELYEIELRIQWIIDNHNLDAGYVAEANSLMDRRDMIVRILSKGDHE